MATRTITGSIKRPNGAPWRGGIVRFKLLDDTFTLAPDETFPTDVVEVVTDSDGAITVALAAGLSSAYRVTQPDGQTFDIVVPEGAATTLELLRADYAISPVPPETVADVIEAVAGTMFVDVAGDIMTGPLTAPIRDKGGQVFNVLAYGPLVADSQAAAQAAAQANRTTINAAVAASAGLGICLVPAGNYFIENPAGATGIDINADGVRLWGCGQGITTLTLADNAGDHVINVVGNDCEIAYLTINGNRANNTPTAHGIRMEGERHHVHDCIIEETGHYGIGLGQALLTDLRYSLFENLLIRNTGGDAIDLKNRQSNNIGNRFRSIVIENFDKQGNTSQAGLDIRGQATVEGLFVSCDPWPDGGSGLRFRDDATTSGSATNLWFFADNSVGVSAGVSIGHNAADVSISNGRAEGDFVDAFNIDGIRATLNNCHAILDGGDVGFETSVGYGRVFTGCTAKSCVTGFNLDGNDDRLIGCTVEDCSTSGVRVGGDRCEIAHCFFEGTAGNGVLIVAAADATRILDSDFTQFSGTDVSNSGTNTAARTNPGLTDIGNQVVFTRLTATAALNFGSIAAQTCAELPMTVTGASAASLNVVQLGVPTGIEAGLSWSGRVSAADTVAIRLCNVTAGAIDPASATWRATVLVG